MAIAFGASVTASAFATSTSFAGPTVSGSDTLLVVGIVNRSGAIGVSSVTYNGGAMTEASQISSAGAGLSSAIYYIKNPAAGSNTIAITMTSGDTLIRATAAYFTGVNQTTPVEAFVSAAGTSSSQPSTNITTLTDGSMVMDMMTSESANALTVGTNQTSMSNNDEGTWVTGSSRESAATAGSVTMNWTGDNSTWVQTLVAIKYAAPDASTLTEEWNSIDTGKWENWGGSPYVTAAGGLLTLDNNPGSTNYYGISTQARYDITGDGVSVQVVSLPTVDSGDTSYSAALLNLEIDANNRYYWEFSGSDIHAVKVTGGSYSYLDTVTYNSAVHKYLKIRESAGTVYFDYSTDGSSYTNFASVASTGVAVDLLYVTFATGHYDVVSNSYTVELDNVNLVASASGQALTAGLVTNTSSFYGPIIAPGTTPLTLSLLTNANTIHSPSVGLTITAPLTTNSSTIHAPSLAVGATTVAPGLVTNTSQFYGPTLAPGPVTITAPLIASTTTIHTPAILPGTVALTAPAITNTNELHAPSVAVGIFTMTAALFTNSSSFYGPTITTGSVTIAASLFVNSSQIHNPLITTGELILEAQLLTNSSQFHTTVITTGPISIAAPLLTNTSQIYGPTIAPGVVNLTSPLLASTSSIYPPSMTELLQLLGMPLIANTSVFYLHDVSHTIPDLSDLHDHPTGEETTVYLGEVDNTIGVGADTVDIVLDNERGRY